jgi:hypothetical protein
MIQRRQRQLARLPGFDPVPNKRIDAAIAGEIAKLTKDFGDPVQAVMIAVQRVVATLPPMPCRRRHRAPRPSKSDSRVYRLGNRCAAATA